MSWNAAHTSSQWSRSAGSTSSSAARISSASAGSRSSSSRKSSTGSSSATSGRSSALSSAAISASSRCSAASSAAGAISDHVGLAERALRERREPAQRLDLVVEQVDADRALLGRRVDVEQAAADGELAAVLDLVDAVVAGRDEVVRRLVEVEQLADAEREAVRAQRRVGHLLAQRDRATTTTTGASRARAPALQRTRVERGHAQADQVGGRREVRLVGDAAARVEAHGARAQPRAQVGGQVARGPVVGGDDHGRAARDRGRRRRRSGTAAATARRTRGRPARRACAASGWCSSWARNGRSDMRNGRPGHAARLRDPV